MRSIVLAAGYTAGHVNTALAFAEAYRKRWPADEIRFVGARGGFESSLLASTDWPFFGLTAQALVDRSRLGQLQSAFALGRGFLEARRHLRARPAALVVGFGSYASVGVVAAAASLRVPTVIHEANAIPGRANKLLGRFVNRIAVAAPTPAGGFGRRSVDVVGLPLRAAFHDLAEATRAPPDPSRAPCRLLVLGGSLGSTAVNACAPRLAVALASRLGTLRVLHQAGPADVEAVAAVYRAQGIEAEVVAFIDDMPAAYRAADYAISAAGAITLAELACAGVPALLLPLRDLADDHQVHNAAAFAAATGALVQAAPTPSPAACVDAIAGLLTSPALWLAAATRMRGAARVDGADRLLELCESLIATPRPL